MHFNLMFENFDMKESARSKSESVFNKLTVPSKLMPVFEICLKLLLASLLVSIVIAQILVGILFILWVFLMAKKMPYKPTRLDIFILIFLVIRIFSIVFSEYTAMSVIAISRELVFYVSFFFTVYYLQHVERTKLFSIFKWLIGSTVIVTLIAIAQVLLGYTARANGLTGGGTLATHLSLVIILTLIARTNHSIFPRAIYANLVLILFACGLFFSMTRGDTIATFVVVLIYASVFSRKMLIGVGLFLIAIIILVPSIRYRFATLANPLDNTSDRLTLWKAAQARDGEHPILGFGPETFSVVFNDFEHTADKNIGAWHNDIIQLYMESGLLGVTSFALIILLLLLWSIKLIRHRKIYGDELNVGWMGLLTILSYLIIGLFGAPTFSITNAILFRFFVAVIAVEYQRVGAMPSYHLNEIFDGK
jgi:O-antigen ligase